LLLEKRLTSFSSPVAKSTTSMHTIATLPSSVPLPTLSPLSPFYQPIFTELIYKIKYIAMSLLKQFSTFQIALPKPQLLAELTEKDLADPGYLLKLLDYGKTDHFTIRESVLQNDDFPDRDGPDCYSSQGRRRQRGII
jgi:hypothetical protein